MTTVEALVNAYLAGVERSGGAPLSPYELRVLVLTAQRQVDLEIEETRS
jgi:hypothetical protein